MSRTIKVPVPDGSITFEVLTEMGFVRLGYPVIEGPKELPLGYVSTLEESNVLGWTMNTESIRFTGHVQVIESTPEDEIGKWRVGLSQNVTAYSRNASYQSSFQIREDMQFGPPIRDGEPAELPFSGADAEFPELNAPVDLSMVNEDNPGYGLPQEITFQEAAAGLMTGKVRNSLSSWFMLARVEAPRMIVLLGRADWTADFDVTMSGNSLQFTANGSFTQVQVTTDLSDLYEANTIPPLGDGTVVPDLRTLASGNEERQAALAQQEQQCNRWVYDDEDGAIAWQDRTSGRDSANWLVEG